MQVIIFPKSIDCHGNVPRQIGKQGTDLSSAFKALSYGEKIVKIGPIYPEMPVFCNVIKSIKMNLVFSGVTGPKFTKFLHDIETSFALLTRPLK